MPCKAPVRRLPLPAAAEDAAATNIEQKPSAPGYDAVNKVTKNNKGKANFCTGSDTVEKNNKKNNLLSPGQMQSEKQQKSNLLPPGTMQSAEISRRIAVFCRGGLREWTGVLDRKPPQGKARQDKRESAAPGIVNKSVTPKKKEKNE